MSEIKQQSPKLELKDIKLNDALKIKLECFKPIKSGKSMYTNFDGSTKEWHLWKGITENATVQSNENGNVITKSNYSGTVVFFPTERLNEELIELAAGKINVEVTITPQAEQTETGKLIKRYVVNKISEGVTAPTQNNLTDIESKLISDAKSLQKTGYVLNEETFIKASQQEMYEGKITEDRAKELFKIFTNSNTIQ